MKTKIYQFLFLMMMALSLSFKLVSQTGTLSLTFTGDNNGQPVTLESVWVKNLTQNCDTTLYPPDFTLVIDTILTGIANLQIHVAILQCRRITRILLLIKHRFQFIFQERII